MSTQKQARLLSQQPEIIVATPGRFWELLQDVKYLRNKNENF
jgi:superfamily II DNA/RNA helicase